jgi:hypothetical protein
MRVSGAGRIVPGMSQSELILLSDAALLVSATCRQLRAQIARGQLPASRVGREIRVRATDVMALYAPRLQEPGDKTRAKPSTRERDQLAKAGFAPLPAGR